MVGVTDLNKAFYESDEYKPFRHNQIISRIADYSRLASAVAIGAGLAIEDTTALGIAGAAYLGATAVQIAKGYLGRNFDYLATTNVRDCLAAFSGLLGASWLTGEASVKDVGIERFALLESLSAITSGVAHLSSRNYLRELEKTLEPRVPLS